MKWYDAKRVQDLPAKNRKWWVPSAAVVLFETGFFILSSRQGRGNKTKVWLWRMRIEDLRVSLANDGTKKRHAAQRTTGLTTSE